MIVLDSVVKVELSQLTPKIMRQNAFSFDGFLICWWGFWAMKYDLYYKTCLSCLAWNFFFVKCRLGMCFMTYHLTKCHCRFLYPIYPLVCVAAAAVIESFPDFFRDKYNPNHNALLIMVSFVWDIALISWIMLITEILTVVYFCFAYVDCTISETSGSWPYFVRLPCSNILHHSWLFCSIGDLQTFGLPWSCRDGWDFPPFQLLYTSLK